MAYKGKLRPKSAILDRFGFQKRQLKAWTSMDSKASRKYQEKLAGNTISALACSSQSQIYIPL
jgi:hypothetical protein